MHVVIIYDSGNATSGDRQRMFINNAEITAFGTDTMVDQNQDSLFVDGNDLYIGTDGRDYANFYFDGYMAEVVFCDGQALTPTSFGEFDEDSPTIWKPKDPSGLTFGNNGFYLDFEDSADLGNDVSGNNNDFTTSGLDATDQATDTPTNNFCTLNAINPTEANASFAEGNLKFTNTLVGAPHHGLAHGTMAVANGKWYFEVGVDAVGGSAMSIGVESANLFSKNNVAGQVGIGYFSNENVYIRGSTTGSMPTYTTNDTIGVALDMDNANVYFHKDGTYINSGDPTSGATGTGAFSLNAAETLVAPAVSNYNSGIQNVNFGSPAFAIASGNADANGYGNFEYAVPSGYYALCTKNLAEYG